MLHLEHEEMCDELRGTHYMVLPDDHAGASITPFINGRFEDGVELCRESYTEEESEVLITKDSAGESVKYLFFNDRIEAGH